MYTWVSMEFRRHGITPLKWNSVDTGFRRHGIPSTRNSVDMEYRRHGILPIILLPYIQHAIFDEFRAQKYAEFRGFPRNFTNFNSKSLQYVRI